MVSASVVLSIVGLLAVIALIVAVLSAMGKTPLWVAVILLCVIQLLSVLPLR